MCVSNFPPVHEICPNYGVVMIQPQRVTIPDLGSVTIVTNFIYSPPSPPVSTVFLGCPFPSSVTPPHISRHLLSNPSLYLYFTRSPSPLLAQSATHIYLLQFFTCQLLIFCLLPSVWHISNILFTECVISQSITKIFSLY